MQCTYHPGVEATTTCSNCGRAICNQDVVHAGGKIVCRACVQSSQVYVPVQAPANQTNLLAVFSLGLAILGLVGCCCGGAFSLLLFGIPAGITGYLARSQIRSSPTHAEGMTLAMVGMGLGIAEVVMAVVLLVFAGSMITLPVLIEMLGGSEFLDKFNY